jgi:hypothetical protein
MFIVDSSLDDLILFEYFAYSSLTLISVILGESSVAAIRHTIHQREVITTTKS